MRFSVAILGLAGLTALPMLAPEAIVLPNGVAVNDPTLAQGLEALPSTDEIAADVAAENAAARPQIDAGTLADMQAAFHAAVASHHGLRKAPKRLAGHSKDAAAHLVLKHLRAANDGVLRSAAWPTIRDAIERDPAPFIEALGLHLAVLAAMAWPEVVVTGADISPDALAVARINVDKHGLQDRIQLQISDGLAALPGPWDLILCNPPYVNAASMAALPAEYRAEPALALAGGSDGMDFVRQLFAAAPACMTEDAVIILEIGNERAHFEAAFPQLPVFWLETSAGEDQVLLVTRQALAAQTRLTAQ